MKKLVAFLQNPYPAHTDGRVYLRTISIISIAIFFILYVIKPFDWSKVAKEDLFVTASISALATFASMAFFFVWRFLFPAFFSERNWTFGREVLLIGYQFTVVALAVWAVRSYFGQFWYIPQRSYGFTWWVVCATGALPYLLATSLKQVYMIRQYLADALALNDRLLVHRWAHERENPFNLPRGLGTLTDFLYAESIENYVVVHSIEAGRVRQDRLRCTLLELEEDNPGSSTFRCHRAFIVNLHKVLHVAGNSAGFQVRVHPELPPVPVSRSYARAFKRQMADRAAQSSDAIRHLSL